VCGLSVFPKSNEPFNCQISTKYFIEKFSSLS